MTMDARKIIEKIKNKKELDEEWFSIRDEIVQFLSEDHTEKEKKMFRPLGYMEVVSMMCNAVENKKE